MQKIANIGIQIQAPHIRNISVVCHRTASLIRKHLQQSEGYLLVPQCKSKLTFDFRARQTLQASATRFLLLGGSTILDV
jgi:hypothetical protein